jgi:uncharacterized SAM-binding protein YcdF (DUF218 family)
VETLVKYLVLPSSAITICVMVSVALAFVRPARLWAILSGALALSVYLVFGTGPISFVLLGALEFQFPPGGQAERKEANTIVVLSGYAESDPDRPLSSQVNSTSAFRILEALGLLNDQPNSTVVISGKGEVASIMRDVFLSSGVPSERVIVDSVSSSTYESAKNLSSRLGQAPFLLVTSAGHMPRSMRVFRKAGAHPIPCRLIT